MTTVMNTLSMVDMAALIVGVVGVVVAIGSVVWARRERAVGRRTYESANRLKNEFVSMVSHELRTPLTSIAGFAEALRDGGDSLDEQEKEDFLNIICSEAGHLSTLVEDILVVPRIEAGRLDLEPVVMDISEVVEELVFSVFGPDHGRDLQVSVPSGVKVYSDPKRSGQIVRNLLANAKNHGGPSIAVEGTYIGTHYQLTVSDNGVGVPADRRSAIFEPFEQVSSGDARANSGIGLGLPIARKLAQQLGGELWFEPRFPTGSRFCVSFPLSQTHVGAMNRAMVTTAVDSSGLSWG